ncbi:unannotated protein [freshwater metagenome]|uniref:Unannotated protein n=1 Tax=freshwater metagenome TaxID=449393 RepID=A0A6J7H5H8_9ZZZZ
MSTAHDAPGTTPIASVRDGLFFTLPEPLPVGRHKLSADHVGAAQRERLLAACCELMAAHGYRGFGIGDVARRARVSLGAFYRCFDGKDACVFAGYDRFIEVLIARLTGLDVEGMSRPRIAAELVDTYLDVMQQDVVVARAFQVEIDALGAPARERRRTSLTLLARYLQELAGGEDDDLPWSAYLGGVYAVRQLAVDALDEEPRPDLSRLGADLRPWLEDLFRVR